MTDFTEITGELRGIHTEAIALEEPFIDTASRFADMPGTVLLLSGGELDCARYHILAAKPWLSFSGRHRHCTVSSKDRRLSLEADPFDVLRRIEATYHMGDQTGQIPVKSGLFGYLAYDLKDCLESLPRTSVDTLGLPHILFFAPSLILVHDRATNTTQACMPEFVRSGESNLAEDRAELHRILDSPLPRRGEFWGDAAGFRSNFRRADYLKAVEKIIDYIAAGDVYQVNMSQRFEMAFSGDSFSLFRHLYDMNPAPFFSYVHAGDHRIVSTSPERFICQSGKSVETRPIKGTRPRGETQEEDERYHRELLESRKDDAELSMIVDLLRNDIGKVCEGGSVRVADHKRIEAYQNVYHLVSIVEGQLAGDKNAVDLIEATFPGGSITGCPKIRTMEIIDELEPNRRHIYTGSIGYVSFHDTMDLSIAIRTATIYNGRIFFSVGGGIVYDSDPKDEYEETLHKGRTLLAAFEGRLSRACQEQAAWVNGTIQPIGDASIPITDQGFQYGYGCFETLRVEKGRPRYLAAHMDRFYRTWKQLFQDDPPDITWEEVIRQVVQENGLADGIAAAKVCATKGDRQEPPFNHTLVVTARPYVHRLAGRDEPGLRTAVYPEPRQSPLADHKTLNYLYYLLAGRWAKTKGADEAIILNPDGTISETNTANIFLLADATVVRPESKHVLPGIMEEVVSDLLVGWGYHMEKRPLQVGDLLEADGVILTNSLIGAVPVMDIDGRELTIAQGLCRRINEHVLGA